MRSAIRVYRPEDFQTLWEIDQSCFAPGISYSQFELKSYIRRRSSFTFVAEEVAVGAHPEPDGVDGARIVGFLVGERSSKGRGHIITIDVRELGRRHGIGSALLRVAEERFEAVSCSAIRLETAVDNIGALSFYKRHGYNVIRTVPGYYSDGVDALLLEKNLCASDKIKRL